MKKNITPLFYISKTNTYVLLQTIYVNQKNEFVILPYIEQEIINLQSKNQDLVLNYSKVHTNSSLNKKILTHLFKESFKNSIAVFFCEKDELQDILIRHIKEIFDVEIVNKIN